MCTYYYFHYHHIHPCTRDIDYSVQFNFCGNSTIELSHPYPWRAILLGPSSCTPSTHGQEQEQQCLVQQPCDALAYAPDYNVIEGIDYRNPCATGGCLISQQCSSGGCRLADLQNRWVCCQCERGGNTLKWCAHPMRGVPDTMCYHVVCPGCWADGLKG